MNLREFFEAVARNWDWGFAALGVGGAGALCGIIAVALLVARRPAALGWALAALALSLSSAGVGLVSRQLELASARRLFASESPVHQARMARLAFEGARRGLELGFAGSLLPLLLGAGAVLVAARNRRGAVGIAAAAALAATAACVGSLLLARAPPPKDAFDFGDHDEPAWDLAFALETVALDPPAGCDMLAVALMPYWRAGDRLEWPRRFAAEPPRSLRGWRPAADGCVRAALDPGSGVPGDRRSLLASPLLLDEGLKSRVQASLEQQPQELPAHLNQDAVRAAVMRHHAELRVCYELELQKHPTLAGRLEVHFTIGADGKVAEATADESHFPSAAVAQCVLARFRALEFPAPDDGQPVEVNYPFVFTPAGAPR